MEWLGQLFNTLLGLVVLLVLILLCLVLFLSLLSVGGKIIPDPHVASLGLAISVPIVPIV